MPDGAYIRTANNSNFNKYVNPDNSSNDRENVPPHSAHVHFAHGDQEGVTDEFGGGGMEAVDEGEEGEAEWYGEEEQPGVWVEGEWVGEEWVGGYYRPLYEGEEPPGTLRVVLAQHNNTQHQQHTQHTQNTTKIYNLHRRYRTRRSRGRGRREKRRVR